ncbi:MAG: FtsX-like permease family protein [Acidobacteriota bacterium]|nr:FtsX-like permease family protein [Acidobacteriota bacterium]
MFGRLLWSLLRGNRGRLAIALVAVISGATVISALLNVEFDIGGKLAQEFRALGPNLLIAPRGGIQTEDAGASAAALMDETTLAAVLAKVPPAAMVGSAPYLYIVARVGDAPVMVAGTELQEARELNPSWKLEGAELKGGCIVGRNVAQRMNLKPGAQFEIKYLNRASRLQVDAVLDSGSAEDDQVLAPLATVQRLAGLPGRVQFEQLRAKGDAPEISAFAGRLSSALPGYDVRPIPQATQAEANLLKRTRLLVGSMVILILVLTALCVLATMAALAMERREDVGLMKALGGSIERIVALFVAEVGVLGASGGAIGCAIGVALAQWIGERVFGASIATRWEVFPATIALMTIVAMTGALPLRLLGRVKPALILRGE